MGDFDQRQLLANAVPLIAVILMASGIVVKTLPLESKRPVETSDAKIAHAGRQDVEARLWQDPFVVMRNVDKTTAAERCQEAVADVAHHPLTLTASFKRALGPADRSVTVMPVFVPGGPYSQDSEFRRRIRYAVIMAVLNSDWVPRDEEKLGYVWTYESCVTNPYQRNAPELLPYEWFSKETAVEKSDDEAKAGSNEVSRESLLILWIDEDAVSRRPLRDMETLSDLLLLGPKDCRIGKHSQEPNDKTGARVREMSSEFTKKENGICAVTAAEPSSGTYDGQWKRTVVLGPWTSTALFGLVDELAKDPTNSSAKTTNGPVSDGSLAGIRPEPRFYSSAATARIDDEMFLKALHTCQRQKRRNESRDRQTGDKEGRADIQCAANPEAIRGRFDDRVVRLNATDDQLTRDLGAELRRRLKWTTPLTVRHPALCKGTIVIVAEGDTPYARAFANEFKMERVDDENSDGGSDCSGEGTAGEHAVADDPCHTGVGPCVVPVGYLRGLDGVAPGAGGAPSNASSAPRASRPSAEDMLMEQAVLERADGPSQYDYLRRLSARLVNLDQSERKAGRHGVAAIGILGNDAYDKILVLDALRDRFPKAVFFAADLDARMLDAGSIGSTRNLVVASGYGLTLTRELQGSAPPFRDTYQTGSYLSTLVALDPVASGLSTNDFKAWFQDSRLYEIGRTQPVNLVGAPRDARKYEPTPGPDSEGCSKPDPAKCRFIHSNEDWRDFDPLPDGGVWIALLLMAATALGLATRLSPRARAVTQQTWSSATVLGTGIVASSLVMLFAGLYAIHHFVRSTDGEPFAWLEGVSIWPTQILGLVILFVTSALFVYGRMRLRTNIDEVANSFRLETLEKREREARASGRSGGARRGYRRWNADVDEDTAVAEPRTVEQAWSDFLERMRFKACAWRVAVATLLFLIFGIALMSLDWPNSPHRGVEAAWFNHVLQVVLIGAVMALLFTAVDASTEATHFLRRVLTSAVDAPLLRPVLPGTSTDGLIGERARGHWTRFRLAVDVAAAVNRLVYLPFIALLLLAPVRSRVFDAWEFSVPYAALLVISLIIAVRCALGLRKQAARLRTRVLADLDATADQREIQAKLGTAGGAPGAGSPAAALPGAPPELQATLLRRLATDIRAVRDGPFRPLSQEPVVRALLLVLGGTGGITTAEFLFLSR